MKVVHVVIEMLDDVNDNFLMQISKDDDKSGDDSGDVVYVDDRSSSVCTGNSGHHWW